MSRERERERMISVYKVQVHIPGLNFNLFQNPKDTHIRNRYTHINWRVNEKGRERAWKQQKKIN